MSSVLMDRGVAQRLGVWNALLLLGGGGRRVDSRILLAPKGRCDYRIVSHAMTRE